MTEMCLRSHTPPVPRLRERSRFRRPRVGKANQLAFGCGGTIQYLNGLGGAPNQIQKQKTAYDKAFYKGGKKSLSSMLMENMALIIIQITQSTATGTIIFFGSYLAYMTMMTMKIIGGRNGP